MKTCRRKWFVQWVAAFVSIVLFGTYLGSLSMNTLTVSAICCRKDGFDKSRYTLTGNVAQDVATIAKSQAGRTCSDFGYSGVDYGAWCDEYVADCLENAGCDDSIVAHGGTVADFEKKMRKRGAVVVSSPQPGDLLFFSWSHVEIVTRVEGGTVYCAGGNNQGKTYPGGRCAGERNAQSVAKSMGGSIRLYLRPNYKGVNPNPPKWAKVTLDHYAWMAGETLTFNLSSEGGVAYTVGIDTENADGGRTRIDTHDTRDTSYSRSFNNPGKYSCYITTYNEYGLADSERIYFEVYDKKPENVSVSL
ncbi:MAG: CHAP domain-containing protein, partial [Ruminococcus callidus]